MAKRGTVVSGLELAEDGLDERGGGDGSASHGQVDWRGLSALLEQVVEDGVITALVVGLSDEAVSGGQSVIAIDTCEAIQALSHSVAILIREGLVESVSLELKLVIGGILKGGTDLIDPDVEGRRGELGTSDSQPGEGILARARDPCVQADHVARDS